MDERLRVAFARYLWCQAVIEGNGVAVAERLAQSPALTAVERAVAGDVIRVEELEHQRRVRRMAAAFGPAPEVPAAGATLAGRSDVELLAAMNHSEALFLRCFRNVATVFDRLATPDMRAEMDVIREEEQGHQAWGARVLRRWRAEGLRVPRGHVRRDSIPAMVQAFNVLLEAVRRRGSGGGRPCQRGGVTISAGL